MPDTYWDRGLGLLDEARGLAGDMGGRMTDGFRAIESSAVTAAGFLPGWDDIAAAVTAVTDGYAFIQKVRRNEQRFGLGLVWGIATKGVPDDKAAIRQRVVNLLWSSATAAFLFHPRFYAGLYDGLLGEITQYYDLYVLLTSGQLLAMLADVMDNLTDTPERAFNFGQVVGEGLMGGLIDPLESADYGETAYLIGTVLGPLLLDLLVALVTAGAGLLAAGAKTLGKKVLVEMPELGARLLRGGRRALAQIDGPAPPVDTVTARLTRMADTPDLAPPHVPDLPASPVPDQPHAELAEVLDRLDAGRTGTTGQSRAERALGATASDAPDPHTRRPDAPPDPIEIGPASGDRIPDAERGLADRATHSPDPATPKRPAPDGTEPDLPPRADLPDPRATTGKLIPEDTALAAERALDPRPDGLPLLPDRALDAARLPDLSRGTFQFRSYAEIVEYFGLDHVANGVQHHLIGGRQVTADFAKVHDEVVRKMLAVNRTSPTKFQQAWNLIRKGQPVTDKSLRNAAWSNYRSNFREECIRQFGGADKTFGRQAYDAIVGDLHHELHKSLDSLRMFDPDNLLVLPPKSVDPDLHEFIHRILSNDGTAGGSGPFPVYSGLAPRFSPAP